MNMLSRSLKKKGYEFPMKVGVLSCESQSEAKNMLKVFEMKYKFKMYEVLRPMFDPNGYAREVLQIGSVIKCINTMENYWANYKDEFGSQDHALARLIVEEIKTYKIKLDVEGLEDDGKHMYSNSYLNKLRGTPISSEPYEDAKEDLDIMMVQIIKRTGKWVEWTTTGGVEVKVH